MFITLGGIYTPARVLQNAINAVMYMQSTLAALVPKNVRKSLRWLLADIRIQSTRITKHLLAIQSFFDFCDSHIFKLHPSKGTLFEMSTSWCGLPITKEGILFYPRRVDGIRYMSACRNGAKLQQFIFARNRMRYEIT